ncbi:hypothetical protein FocTR4_00012175, partial [Fusarium oxysporum f. sp. cubense]
IIFTEEQQPLVYTPLESVIRISSFSAKSKILGNSEGNEYFAPSFKLLTLTQQSAEAFLQWVEKVDPTTWIVYSDGSLSSEGVASCGFAIHQKDLSICEGSGR